VEQILIDAGLNENQIRMSKAATYRNYKNGAFMECNLEKRRICRIILFGLLSAIGCNRL
jgi:hypothetical protein